MKTEKEFIKEKIEGCYVVGKTGCWLWRMSLGAGYAQRRMKVFGQEHTRVARILLCFRHSRNLRREEYALHSCDEPRCVNPAHIRLGGMSENIKEAYAKGRKKLDGGRHAILNSAEVRRARAFLRRGTTRQAATACGVSQGLIMKVKKHRHPYED
jgi:hypothetical protein